MVRCLRTPELYLPLIFIYSTHHLIRRAPLAPSRLLPIASRVHSSRTYKPKHLLKYGHKADSNLETCKHLSPATNYSQNLYSGFIPRSGNRITEEYKPRNLKHHTRTRRLEPTTHLPTYRLRISHYWPCKIQSLSLHVVDLLEIKWLRKQWAKVRMAEFGTEWARKERQGQQEWCHTVEEDDGNCQR